MLLNKLKRGDMIVFSPPPGAYSRKSLQHRYAGSKGFIARMQSEEYGLVVFPDGPCLLNLRYCEKQ